MKNKDDKCPNIDTILQMIRNYIDKTEAYIIFELDFGYELEKRYRAMKRENPRLTELIWKFIYEDGVCAGQRLSKKELHSLIKEQYDDMMYYYDLKII